MGRSGLRKKVDAKDEVIHEPEFAEDPAQPNVFRESVGTASKRDVSPNTPRGESI